MKTRVGGVVLVLAITSVVHAQSPEPCGTTIQGPEHAAELAALQARLAGHEAVETDGPIYIPLTIHIVRNSVGTGGLEVSELCPVLDDLNVLSAQMGLQFYVQPPIRYINNNNWTDIESNEELYALLDTYHVPFTVNSFFVPDLIGGTYCGVAVMQGTTAGGVVIDNDCAWSADLWAHEIGHVFSLLHTHNSFYGEECVDGSNCAEAGDMLCDTPADPNLADLVDPDCVYTGTALDPCNNDPYQPDTTNIMSHSRLSCRDTFSPQQINQAMAFIQVEATDLIHYWIPDFADCDGNGIADFCDPDCDGDMISDACELVAGSAFDCNGNMLPDDCDIAEGTAQDCNVNGVPDTCDIASAASLDVNGDGIPDECQFIDDCDPQLVTASDGAPGDSYGAGMVDRWWAAIGAPFDDDLGDASGALYIYQQVGTDWTNETKVHGSDVGVNHRFGLAVAGNDDWLMVSAPLDGDMGVNAGKVYVYQRFGSSWFEVQELLPDGAGEEFGEVISMDGEWAAIGAFAAAYVYQRVGDTWVRTQKLVGSETVPADRFGNSVSIHGTHLAVGAYRDSDIGVSPGSVYLYRFDGSTWTEEQEVYGLGAYLGGFGSSVALHGDSLLVGAPQEPNEPGDFAGSVALFQWDPATQDWWFVNRVFGPQNGSFGTSLRLEGDLALAASQYAVSVLHREPSGIEIAYEVPPLAGYSPGSAAALKDGRAIIARANISTNIGAAAIGPVFAPIDCNGNGEWDGCDVISGVSADCDENGVPDECDPDCNGNGVPDECDIASGDAPDCNGNGVPDSCDAAAGGDCDGNGVPDECDPDCNVNGVPDACDITSGTSADSDGDGLPDECEMCVEQTLSTPASHPLVATDGTVAVVGIADPDAQAFEGGSIGIRVLRRGGDSWALEQEIAAPADRHFVAAAVSGNVIAVSHRVPFAGGPQVQIYRWSGSEWAEEAVLLSGTVPDNGFGFGLGVEGDRLVVSNWNVENTETFEWSAASGWEAGPVLAHESQFVALRGDTLVLGDVTPPSGDGAVHLYRWDGATYVHEASFEGNPADEGTLGLHVSADANLATTTWVSNAAPYSEVRLYTRIDDTWTAAPPLVPEMLSGPQATFGLATAIDDGRVLVGDVEHLYDASAETLGIIHVYELVGESWVRTGRMRPESSVAPGGALAAADGWIVSGEPEQTTMIQPICPEDVNGDGVVGFGDVLTIIASWGPCGPGDCPGDVNGDGDVGFGDILAVIGGWTP
ncbi:MAG: hypothetical protein ACYTGP_07555 [Planctomycetota bacterium]|jgi:hypothetical protein